MGYCLTGTLERGCERTNQYQTTHFAVIRRCWPSNEHDGHHGGGFGVGGVGGGGGSGGTSCGVQLWGRASTRAIGRYAFKCVSL
uniref:Uncharacterized protein n=1 Tax=Anopheles stephensi TaxID=30069 RepID=A0A182YR40_ANOST